MPDSLKVGLIGLDNSHAIVFTKLLNDASDPHHLAGAKMTVGFPGLPSDFHWSYSRVEKFTSQLRDEWGVNIVGSAAEVAGECDLVLMTAVDARQHRQLFEQILPLGKPTFIDKPLATSLADARWIVQAAQQARVPLMCSSALRYADNFRQALAGEPLMAIDVYGPVAEEPAMPGLFWYGVHCVEMVVTALGAGCRGVRAVSTGPNTLVCLEWGGGRSAFIRGLQGAHGSFGAALHRADCVQQIDINANRRPYYVGLLETILAGLAKGEQPVPREQMLEVVAIMEAANRSRSTGQEATL
jgi:predicted dehydrogenase